MTGFPMIQARKVLLRVARTVLLRDVTLDVHAGEVVALVGPNGAGKSSLLAAIAGDRPLARGQIRIAGRDVTTEPPRVLATLRAVLRQRSPLAAAFTALEVVQLGQLATGPGAEASARAALARVELDGLAHRSYPTLSGGEQQRVQLARVLAQAADQAVHSAMAVLLDEPTSALDLRHRQLVARLARRAAADGHAVVIVVHDLDLAVRAADRVIMLAGGQILADGAPSDVLTPALIGRAFDVPPELATEVTNDLARLRPAEA